MNKIFLTLVSLVTILSNTTFSQSDSIQWNKLFKHHNNVETVYDDYVDKFWVTQYMTPIVFVDSITTFEPKSLEALPYPINGAKKLSDSINYPVMQLLPNQDINIGLTALIDTIGNPKNIEVKYGRVNIYSEAVTEVLKKTKFIPAFKNGKSIESRIGIAVSFVVKQKKNIQIDTIIVDKSACYGPCPSYKITLCKTGDVFYDGHYYVDKLGKWKSTFNKNEFEGLTSLIFAINFFNMKEKYSTNVTDMSWITITVISKQTTKMVRTDFYLPLWEFAKLVDCLTKDLDWEEID